MKTTLEYDLPEEEYSFRCAINGQRMDSILDEISQLLRQHQKYDVTQEKTLEDIRRAINEYLELDHR